MNSKPITRRQFLKFLGVTAATIILSDSIAILLDDYAKQINATQWKDIMGVKLQGINPMTGYPHHFIVGERNPHRTNILINHTDIVLYSVDAGRTWCKPTGIDLREVDVII